MDTLKKFGFPVGFSDHTVGIDVPIAAVARGAKIIEKHFTISRKLSGPDHIFAIEPNELKVLINRIRETETYLGSNEKTFIKNVENSEYIVRIFSKEKIFSGQIIRDEMICIKRSNYGLLPHEINSVIGKIAKNDIDSDSPIVSSDF
jgi:sialic acid synthase SpsE